MSVDGETPRPTGPTPPLSGDWPAQAADVVVNLVGTVRDRTVGPLEMVARALVYGLVVVPLAVMALVLVVVGLLRLLDNWLDTWAVYLILGVVFTGVGLVIWSKRRPKNP